MMPTMFAAYDYYGETAPRFSPLQTVWTTLRRSPPELMTSACECGKVECCGIWCPCPATLP